MTAASSDPRDAVRRLKEAYRVLITCHRNPDGDALGSELALAEMADRFGVRTVIVNRDRRDVRVFRTINAFEPPILVLFFTLAGCHIDPEALLSCGCCPAGSPRRRRSCINKFSEPGQSGST